MRPKGQLFDLKAFRVRHNLSQKAVAEAVKRPQSFLSAIENGKRSAPPGFLDDLVRLYNEDNISDYISDRVEPDFGDVKNVRDAIVNSPGGVILMNEFGGKLSAKDIKRILEIEEEMREESVPHQKSSEHESSTVAELVKLLTAAEQRNREAEAKIKELERQVEDLQAQLPKRKK